MTYLVIGLLVLFLVVALWLLRRTMNEIVAAQQQVVNEVRLATRTRQSKISVQSGPVTEEQKLKRLGRATVARRVVVGGDADSELHTNLSRPLGSSNGSE